jgi:hypothetical protein
MHPTNGQTPATGTRGRLPRRGLMTVVAAVVASGVAKVLGSDRAAAANDDPVRIGQSNTGTLTTSLSGTATKIFEVFSSNTAADSASIVASPPNVTGGRAVAAFANFNGTYGFFAQTSNATAAGFLEAFDAGTGVHGKSSSGYGARGQSGSNRGVLGTSGTGSGVFGYSGGATNPVTHFESNVGVQAVSDNGIGLSAKSNTAEAIKAVTTASGAAAITVQGPSGMSVSASNNATGLGVDVVGGDIAVRGVGRSVGLRGQSDTGNGVFGTNTSNTLAAVEAINESSGGGAPGVKAVSNNNVALLALTPNTAGLPAVQAESTAAGGGPGMRTDSVSNFGLYGQTTAAAGAVAGGFRVAGVLGRATKNVGVYGYDDGAVSAMPSYGMAGQSASAYGIFGYSGAPSGTAVNSPTGTPSGAVAVAGVFGSSAGNPGVYGISGSSIGVAGQSQSIGVFGAVLPGAGPSALAGLFIGNVQIQGNLQVTGAITRASGAAQVDPAGARVAALDNPETLVAIGEAQLAGGRAEVRLQPAFAAAMADDRYHVFLTEYGDHSGLYVAQRTRQSFEVRAKDSPTAGATFSYRVVARPRDVAPVGRTDQFEVRPSPIPVPSAVPSLPVPEPLPPRPAGDGAPRGR